MNPREFFQSDDTDTEKLCSLSGTTVSNFRQISLFGGSVSAKLAHRLATSSLECGGLMSVNEILFPDDRQMQNARSHRKRLIESRNKPTITDSEKTHATR